MRYLYNKNNDGFICVHPVLLSVAGVWRTRKNNKSAAEDTNGKINEPNQKSVLCASADYQSPFLYIKYNCCMPSISRCTAINKYNSLYNHVTVTIYTLNKCNYIPPPLLYNMLEITQHYVKLSLLLKMC